MDDIMIGFQNQEEEEEEEFQEVEALSLCDFPLISSDAPAETDRSNNQDHRNLPSQPSDFFEFYNDFLSSENMSDAEDIISGGRLVPYKLRHKPLFDDRILKSTCEYDDDDVLGSSRRYCESLPELNRPTRSDSGASTRLRRSSRSVDYRDSRRNSSLIMNSNAAEVRRSLAKSSLKESKPRPRWYAWMSGLVKFPAPEMNLREMKSRKVRRNPGSMFAAADCRGANRSDRRSSWSDDLLRVLICKDDACVAVAPSINGLVPQV